MNSMNNEEEGGEKKGKQKGSIPAHRRVDIISCGVIITASIFLNFGRRKKGKQAQW